MTPTDTSAPTRSGPLLLLDGMSLAFRAYFALPADLAKSDGVVTNAVHGFTSMLVYLLHEHTPSAMAVAFDLPEDTFRDALVEDYKGGRDETPSDLLPQFDLIRQVVESLAIPVIGVPGFEADDVLATLATQARDRACDVIVVTGDRDAFQLVEDPHVRVLYNRRGVSDYSLYDAAGIFERTGLDPARYPMLASLRGDTSDNLPGVPGVGEKTAAKLLTTYGDLDGVFAHLGELSPKLRQNLAEYEPRVRSNFSVIPLVRDVALPITVEQLTLGGWDFDRARQQFVELELTTVWRRLTVLLEEGVLGEPAPGSAPARAEIEQAVSKAEGDVGADRSAADGPPPGSLPEVVVGLTTPAADQLGSALAALRSAAAAGGKPVGVAGAWAGDRGRSDLVGLVVVAPESGPADRWQGVWIDAGLVAEPGAREALVEGLAGPVVGHEVKELWRSLLPAGPDGRGLAMDVAVAGYLLDPSSGDYALAALRQAAGAATPAEDGGAKAKAVAGQLDLDGAGRADPSEAAGCEAAQAAQLYPILRQRLEDEGLAQLHDQVELPLVRVLARMEDVGIAVDAAELRRIADELVVSTTELAGEVYRLAGREFNLNSPTQLRVVLYDELGLTPGRKTKTGYSTDASTLDSLRDDHPVVDYLLRYREVEKLRSTYGEALLHEVAGDGRIHASFRQTVARTGRLSSERPNLHNIPVRTEAGKRFRAAFVPAPDHQFLVADYDQIELRVLAHLSGDPGLVEAFATGADIHRTVASGVYSVPPEEVTHTQRDRAKMVSYGLAYGMEAFGLARRLSTGVEEASEIIERYFSAFPEVRAYMNLVVEEARARGFTRTERGRKRPLPELNDRNYRVRQQAERQAMNAGIQGLAADLFKVALVRLDAALAEAGLASRLILQVHDEVLVEVPAGEEEVAARLTTEALLGAATLRVPLVASMGFGASWAGAKG